MELITGATGFIGSRLLTSLRASGREVRAFARRPVLGVETVVGDICDAAAAARACTGVTTVYHCAGFAHAMRMKQDAMAALNRAGNLDAVKVVGEAAARAGVTAFVALSSVKAMGPGGDACIDETWSVPPDSDYGRAKCEAEVALARICRGTAMRAVALRPAMVYGAGGRGNLPRMVEAIRRGAFPPLPETGNRRSFVHVDDVVDALRLAGEQGGRPGECEAYILAHADAYSGRAVYDAIREALGLPPVRVRVPRQVLRGMAWCCDLATAVSGLSLPFGHEVYDRLLGSAWYSTEKMQREMGWSARIDLATGLREMLSVNQASSQRC